MKKLIISILSIMVCGASYAGVTMCKHLRTFVLVLSKSTNGTGSTYNASAKTWSVEFDYTTMTGISSCNEIDGTANTANTGLFTSSNDVGTKCWCTMERPAASYWTYLKTYGDESACASNCAADCADAVKTSTLFRTGMFESIW